MAEQQSIGTQESISFPSINISIDDENFEENLTKSIPIQPDLQSISIVEKNLEPIRCTIEGLEFIGDSSAYLIDRLQMNSNEDLYIIHNREFLHWFTISENIDSCNLTLQASSGRFFLFDPINFIEDDLYTSKYRFQIKGKELVHKRPQTQEELDNSCAQSFVFHPYGEWGLDFSSSIENQSIIFSKLIRNGDRCKQVEWEELSYIFYEVSTVNWIGTEYIAVGGSKDKNEQI